MKNESRRAARRGTPISNDIGADLQALGGILANHTRGLDAYLNRQAQRINERHQNLLDDIPETLLSVDANLDLFSKRELQAVCRQNKLRGWSRLDRASLLAFVKDSLHAKADTEAAAEPNRTERLLLLLLHHLGVPSKEVDAAWLDRDCNP